MYENTLSRLFGINKNNYKNYEYILQTSMEYSTNDITLDRLYNIVCDLVSESNVFSTVIMFDTEGNMILEKKKIDQLNIHKAEVSDDNIYDFEEKLRCDVGWLDECSWLYRIFVVFNKSKNSVKIYLAFHHSIMDGLGVFNFLERIQLKIIGNVPINYSDTNEFFFEENNIKKNCDYWNSKFEKYSDYAYTKTIEDINTIEVNFTKNELTEIGENKKNIMMATLLSIIRTYPIFNYNECSDIAIDFATNLRKKNADLDLGMYVNIMPIFMDDFYKYNLIEAESLLKKALIGVFRHSNYPVYEVGKSYSNIMFSYIPLSQYPNLKKYYDKILWLDTGRGPYDFAYSLFDGDNYIRLRIDYKKNKFEQYEMESYLKWLKEYIISYFTIDSAEKENLLLSAWNPRIFERRFNVNQLNSISFEDLLNETFRANGTRIAFSDGIHEITYNDVAFNIKKIAEAYREKAKCCKAIIIYGTPSIEMFVIMMTAIYLGVPYIFSGPKIPINTVKYLNGEFKNIFFSDTDLEDIETEKYPELVFGAKNSIIEFVNPGHDLLTYFCTSGTTGEPKVIPDKRSGMNNLINNKSNTYIEEGDTSLLISSLTFDLTIDPIYRSILKGGTIVIVEIDKLFNKDYILNLIDKTGADTLLGTPSALSGICDEAYEKLTKVGSVGETLTKSLANRLNSFKNLRLFNCYGPTEATCYCHLIELTGETYTSADQDVPIGYVIDGMESIIVDPFDCELPDGLQGELLLSGVGVLDDYYNYKGTDKVFSEVYGQRWYHSGDMCRHLNDLYYYIARKGKQVKINGYRIELSAIEKKLENYLANSFKLMVINGILVVFHEGEIDDVQNRMLKELPSYMVPKKFIKIEQLPTNKNQKVNTRLLEEIYKENTSSSVDISSLEPVEKEIYDIYSKVLGINNFGIDDSLYELGGNSFTIIQISNQLKEKYSCIDFDKVMKYMNVRQLANYINSNHNTNDEYQFDYDIKDEYKTSKMQRSMILKQVINRNDTSYHIGVMIPAKDLIISMDDILDYCKGENEFHYQVSYHDNNFYMKYNHGFLPKHNIIEINNLTELQSIIKPFDLFNDTLIRYSDVIINGELKYYLFEMHHLISDGVTLKNTLSELTNKKDKCKRVAFWSALEYMEKKEEESLKEGCSYIESLKKATPSKFQLKKQEMTVQKHFVFDSDLVSELNKFLKNKSLSLQSCLSSLIVKVLGEKEYIEKNENRVIVGTPVNLRNCVEIENTYGPMIQMLPFVVHSGSRIIDMEGTRNAIGETIKNKFISYEHIVNECQNNLFELVITSFDKYIKLSSEDYNQDIALYPDKFGTTIFIYEGNEKIELVMSSHFLTDSMMGEVINELYYQLTTIIKGE